MSDPYERVKGGRLTFKDGSLASRSKAIDKKKKKKKKTTTTTKQPSNDDGIESASVGDLVGDDAIAAGEGEAEAAGAGAGEEETYTIDAAKRMKYDQLFPVEAKKFGYDPKAIKQKSVEAALDDRVKKKADRYCK